jgi:pilus assembly protein CpaB
VLIASKLSAFGDAVVAVPPADPARRAMAVRVEGEAVQAGLIGPGDLIDLVLAEGTGRALRAVTVLVGVRVLGVGQSGLITVEVSPADGQSLALAQQAGVLVAVLHLSGAAATARPDAVALQTLMGETSAPAAGAAPLVSAPVSGVVVRRGGETSIEPVPRSTGQ